jgi:hypothetical protein
MHDNLTLSIWGRTHFALEQDGETIGNDSIFKWVPWLNRTCGTEYTESTTTVSDIKLRIMHVAFIVIGQNILFVVLHQLHHSHQVNLPALNQEVAVFVTMHIALTTEAI